MFMPLIRKRRSIRKFLNKDVEAEKVDQLVEAALRAPSSRGLNPWEFIIVTEKGLLEKLSKAKKHGSSFLDNAAVGVVVCADPEKCDVWIEDASIASAYIQLAAESLGLGSCWVQIRDRLHDKGNMAEEYVSGLLNIPGNLRIESVIAIGYPDEKKPPHSREELQYEKVHLNLYGRSYGK
ncbi:MAG: nitroreductase family protein [Nitrospirota bacterium]|nr:nitroreductase family protein [Nitrospirota bacterium]